MRLRIAIRAALGFSALAAALPASAQETYAVDEVIVTAQKREENVQDVPIAVTALMADDLLSQRIDFGAELTRAVPNLFFTRQLGGEYNFQIRGIGSQLLSTAGDAGVGVHSNNVPLSVNRLADAEFFDLDRIEVLRGPQGTLYGRNATGGVINAITNKPKLQEFSSAFSLEYAEFDTRKVNGYINLPVTDTSALRVAGVLLQREGYTENTLTNSDIDGRDLYSARITYAFAPTENFRASLMYERFDEDDNRTGGLREFCAKDPGPTTVGGVATGAAVQNFLSRGCLDTTIYDPAALGTVNYTAALAGQLGILSGLLSGDIYSGVTQSPDLREVAVRGATQFMAVNELFELNVEWNLTDKLLLTSLTSYNTDDLLLNRADNASYVSNTTFNNVAGLAPGGVYNDPQIGASSFPQIRNIQDNEARQRTSELRLQSAFEGPWNFNVGGIYIKLERTNDLFIIPSASNAFVELANLLNNGPGVSPFTSCRTADCYFDPSPFPDGTGHNYFVSHVPYELTAKALFGEVYYDISDKVRLTTGLRYTDDKKEIELNPSNLLLPGRGATPNGTLDQVSRFKETTGRVNLNWHPTENNLVYLSYSKGYKGGGINNPDATSTSPSYDPEFVNAYELGSKNTFAEGRVQLNVTGFFYDYDGYQISSRRGLIAQTENVDAEVRGLELEGVWKPIPEVRLNATLGWLETEITSGSSLDTFDRIQGQAGVTLVKSTSDACIAPTANLAQLIAVINANPADALGPSALFGVCAGQFSSLNPANPLAGLGIFVNPSSGNPVDLTGKELPQSPDFTASLGAQYNWSLNNNWEVALRADYYYSAESFARFYNSASDQLKSFDNANAAITADNKQWGLSVQLYAKNLFNDDTVTGFSNNTDLLGLTRSAQLLDPRLIGILVSKQF
jgi:outer membrane receptor protein involved in Fe transport